MKICEKVLPQGFIFIWTPKSAFSKVMDIMTSWGLTYVENICWAKFTLGNKINTKDSPYLNTSKSTLMIFRKVRLFLAFNVP